MKDQCEYKETFNCDQCDYTYSWKSHLVKSVHEHNCTYCEKTFGRKENLTVRIQSLHEDGEIF